jgi:hypothetical protein
MPTLLGKGEGRQWERGNVKRREREGTRRLKLAPS